jgi:hypothetical protein
MIKESNDVEQNSSIPESLLTRLFDFSGSIQDGTKGFTLFYINSTGQPSVYSRTSNACVDMALHKLLELYVSQPQNPNQNP